MVIIEYGCVHYQKFPIWCNYFTNYWMPRGSIAIGGRILKLRFEYQFLPLTISISCFLIKDKHGRQRLMMFFEYCFFLSEKRFVLQIWWMVWLIGFRNQFFGERCVITWKEQSNIKCPTIFISNINSTIGIIDLKGIKFFYWLLLVFVRNWNSYC